MTRLYERTQPPINPRPIGYPPALAPTVLDTKIRPQGNPRPPRQARRSHPRLEHNGPWGTSLDTNKQGVRIGFQNINGLPVDATHTQHSHLITTLTTHSFDIFGAQEININLQHIEPFNQWGRRFKGSNFFTIPSHNTHAISRERRLFGGTALFVANSTSPRITDHGTDHTGLGGWSWILISGRQGIQTRIINGYRPVKDTSNRPGTVYSQQEKYYYDQGQPREPREAFLEDLATAIHNWTTAGEQIILGLDLNEYIQSPNMVTWANNLGLYLPLQRHHHNLPDVDTCDKSHRNRPINGIWTTNGIDITQGGMTGFGEVHIGSSDHRLLWIDVSAESIYGFTPSQPARRPHSFFPIQDPKAVRRYNNTVVRERQEYHIPTRLLHLAHKASTGTFTVRDKDQYELICAQDDAIRQKARQHSRRFYAGQVLYSDVIGLDYQELKMWSLIIKRRLGVRTDTRHIRRLMHKTQQLTALQLTLEEAKQAKQQCFRRYLKHKREHVQLRTDFERKQDQRIANAKGITLAAQQKMRTNTRQIKNKFSHIRQIIGTKLKGSLLAVTSQDPHTQHRTEYLNREDIEEACSREGQRRFSQAHDTPFFRGSLLHDLGTHGDQHVVDQILTGTYVCADDVDGYTRLFLQELQIPDRIQSLPVITGIATSSEHAIGWKRMNHATASSPFGPRFQDYIAGTHNQEVTQYDNLMANIPLMAGFCPDPWTKAVDVMISKKTHSSDVDKLRIIVLFHAMFNMINKRVGRAMIQQAIQANEIPLETFGSVPGRRANECALNKVLVNDILRQQHRPAALCSNDATSCYDRIVHVVASLCMQRLGVHSHTCKVMFATLQQLQHHVSTAYGTSPVPYGGIQFPLQGVGQGNGAGPAIWLVMTIPMIQMLRKQGFGFKATSPVTHHSCHLACFTYVDDTDTIHAPLDSSAQEVVRGIQEAIKLWEGGLRATGGALSPSKSYWYLIDFKWHPTQMKWVYKTTQDCPGQLYLTSPTGDQVPLQRHEPSHAIETLGIPIAMDGNQTGIVNALQQKIDKWASKISTKQLTLSETVLSLHYGICKTLDYPLTATRLNKRQCNLLIRSLRRAVLPALHVPTTFPTVLAHAPKEYLGLNIPNLWFEQGFAQMDCLLRHSFDMISDSTTQLYQHVVEGLQLELGLPGSPFAHDYYLYAPSTTDTHLHVLWQYSWDMGLTIHVNLPNDTPPRVHDQHLMAYFPTQGFTAKELRLLNLCRLHLRIKFVSDLCTGDGQYLKAGAPQDREPSNHHSHLGWPVAGEPNPHCWALWRRAIYTLARPHPRQPHVLSLLQPLGPWNHIPQGWPTFITPDGHHIYHRQPDTTLYTRADSIANRYRTRQTQYTRQPGLHTLPLEVLPSSLTTRGDRWTHTGTAPLDPPIQPPQADNGWWGTVVHATDELQHLLDGIVHGTAIVVTDGSYRDGLGTAAFTLQASPEAIDGIECVNMTPGSGDNTVVDAFRAELGGIYGSIKLVHSLLAHRDVRTGTITLACDCLAAIRRLTQPAHPPPKVPHYDLIMDIRLLLQHSPIAWQFQHVLGHQDQTQQYNLLDRPAQLNVDMDRLAKTYWTVLNAHRPPSFSPQSDINPCSLWCGSHRITSWDRKTAQKFFYNRSTSAYWQKHSPTPLQDIHWQASGAALRRMALYQQTWIPRWLTSFLPIGQRLALINPNNSNACPRCNLPESHRHHILRCPHPEAVMVWNERINHITAWLDRQHTKPSLRQAILTLLAQWYEDSPWTPPDTTDEDDTMVFEAQQRAGTGRVVDGFLVYQWAEAQQRYYDWIQHRYTGKRWLSQLIKKLWETAWDLWRHRQKILQNPTALFLSRLHNNVDLHITQLYQQHTLHPHTHLNRWFSQPLPSLIAESLDFKQQWLAMVRAIQDHNDLPH